MVSRRFWTRLRDAVQTDGRAVLVVLVQSQGHAPNGPGAKMVVTAQTRFGTVGGGSSEHDLAQKAQALLDDIPFAPEVVTLEHVDEMGDRDGRVCGGVQRFVLVGLDRKDLEVLGQLSDADENRTSVTLVISPQGLAIDSADGAVESEWQEVSGDWRYAETVGTGPLLSIIGGGHVALALSQVMANLDFEVRVFDNRPNLDTMDQNIWAHRKAIIDYSRVREHIPEGPSSHVCIMTYAHAHDQDVLERLIDLDLAYLGLMGSPRKIRLMRENLLEKGIPAEQLNRVRMPIGLDIGSQTPQEIAVSIAAQFIRLRRGQP